MNGHPIDIANGTSIEASIPAGCVLRRSYSGVSWTDVSDRVFVHVGGDAQYRIDCDTYTVPVTAVLTITPA